MSSKTQRVALLARKSPQQTEAELKRHADDANRRHAQASQAYGDALNYAYWAGRSLLSAKLLVGHGNWQNWVEKNFSGSLRIPAEVEAGAATMVGYREVFPWAEQLQFNSVRPPGSANAPPRPPAAPKAIATARRWPTPS